MPRSKEANEKLRKETTQKILDGAVAVFATKGNAATMADIAIKAGVSQGLAYHYFKSKEEIFAILVKQAAEAGGGPVDRIDQIKGTPGKRLALLVTYILEDYCQNSGMAQVMYNVLEDETAPSDLKGLVLRNGKAIQNIMRQLIVEGQATGEIVDEDPDQLMVALLACFNGLMKRATMLDPNDAKNHFPEAKIILRMLRPENQGERTKK
jgi:AcrR family transcriptional regulator